MTLQVPPVKPGPLSDEAEASPIRRGTTETVYAFSGYEKLLADFWADVETWRQR